MPGAELVPVFPSLALVERETPTLSPVRAYLATLAPRSRTTMANALKQVATLAGFREAELVPWATWRYEHTAALRARLEERRLAPSTANTYLTALRMLLKTCFRLELISAETYARAVDVAPMRGSRLPPGRALTRAELEALFAACDPLTPGGAQRACLLALLFGAGLRIDEALSLSLEQMDRAGRCLRVRGKGNKERMVPLPAGSLAWLDRWLLHRGEEPGPLIQPVPSGRRIARRRMSTRAALKALVRLAKQAGIEQVKSHDFRRTFANALWDASVDYGVVSQLMGHASLDTTRKYDRRGERALFAAVHHLDVPTGGKPA